MSSHKGIFRLPPSLSPFMSPTPAAAAVNSLQSCSGLCNPIDGSPTRLPHPWDSPGKNTGVGCHFLLQCMKVKRESEVAQSCPTLRDPMGCSPPGSSVHGVFQATVPEWGAIAFSAPTPETLLNFCFCTCCLLCLGSPPPRVQLANSNSPFKCWLWRPSRQTAWNVSTSFWNLSLIKLEERQ